MITFQKPDVEQFLKVLTIQDFTVSPDKKQLVFSTNIGGHFNLWAMDLPNQYPYPLTSINQACDSLLYNKKSNFILAGFDQDGDENSQLYALSPKGGSQVAVRYEKGERHMFPFFSKNGESLYYTSTKDGHDAYLAAYRYNLSDESEEILIEGTDTSVYLMAVSPEEKSFVYSKNYGNTSSLLFVKIDGEDVLATPESDQQFTQSDPVYTSEQEIYFITNYESDFSYLAKFDLAKREFSKVLELKGKDASALKYDDTLQKIYVIAAKGVKDELVSYDLADQSSENLEIPVDRVNKMEVTEAGELFILGQSATIPLNIFTRTPSHSWEQITNHGVTGMRPEDLVEPETVTYASFDGMEIEASLYRAHAGTRNGHMIIWPHGGPQAAETNSFRALFQFLLNCGYSIFTPNFRGSARYGLSFMKMVEGEWGNGPRHDMIAGIDWLIEQGIADKEKIFLMGGSFGGYMALLLHGRHSEYFKAVVDIFGPSDLFSFINSVPEFWKSAMDQWVGNPERDREKLIDFSPITHLDGMTKPMLVIQGANDPRVVKAESDKIVEALRQKGRSVDYMVLEDEGHGFTKKENEILVYRAIADFFNQYL
ncbi:S9 family peptidase [Peribacillus frigoritolerans]|uniref:S9 family peptidase n=1 Tax=Peribacillus frigoritolerans TaxID=450367 RepID=UPI00105998C0|nr:S9 family peptidase [Peribacillus frigoritolerans]TDL83007.1 S9 family peptidase [Peribacillus frigoritolerans]